MMEEAILSAINNLPVGTPDERIIALRKVLQAVHDKLNYGDYNRFYSMRILRLYLLLEGVAEDVEAHQKQHPA